MAITFDNIPRSIRKPGSYSEYNLSLAQRGLAENAQKVALIGQKLATGTATVNIPVKCYSADEAETYGGVGSILALAAKAAFTANRNIDLDLVPLDDGVGTLATGTIQVEGVASATGYFDIWIANVLIQVAVESGDAVNDIATAVNTAIQAKQHLLPVTAGVSTDTVTLTARNDGLLGNDVSIAYKNHNVGTTDLTVTQMSGGTVDPDITTALSNIYAGDYNIIICTLNDGTNLALLKTHLNSRSAPTEGRPAIGVFGYVGVQATLETLAGTTLNSGRLIVGYLPYTDTTQNGHSLQYEIAGALGAVLALHEDPALPYNRRVLTGIGPSHIDNRLSRSNQESCLDNGVTPLIVKNNEVEIVRAISTYTTNSGSIADAALLDITTIRSLDYVRYVIEADQQTVFARTKATAKTKQMVRSRIIFKLRQLEDAEIVENVDENLDLIIVERDSIDRTRFNCEIPCDVVNGAHIFANKINLYL